MSQSGCLPKAPNHVEPGLWGESSSASERFKACTARSRSGQVFVHGGLQDGVGGVEVAVGEVVAHAGDLPPWDRGLGGQQVIR